MRALKFAAVIAAIALLPACGTSDAKGEDAGADAGIAGTAAGAGGRSFAASGFTGIELAGPDNVVVTRGAAFSVVATGPDDVLDKLKIEVKDGVLVVSRKPSGMNWGSDKGASVAVTLPALRSAELTGSGDMTIDTASGDAVDLVLAGSGNLQVASVTAKALDIALAGSGDISVKGGKADSGEVALAGSGDIDMKGVTLTSADISIAGAGDVDATATGTADVSIVGSGDVRLGGGAKCDSSELGSGTVSCS